VRDKNGMPAQTAKFAAPASNAGHAAVRPIPRRRR
jgi:hypothetical protein